MRITWSTLLLSSLVCFAQLTLAADSIEDLLNQADAALNKGNSKSVEVPANAKSEIGPPTPQKKSRPQIRGAKHIQKPRVEADTTSAIKPLENPQIDEIVSLDVKHKEAERIATKNYAAISLLIASHNIGPGFEMEKDEDFFSIDKSTALKGLMLQFNTPRATFTRANAPWGYVFGMRAGYFLGEVPVARRGVMDDNRSYEYQIIPVDFYTSLSYKPKKWIEMQLTAGAGADFYHQAGEEDVETLTDVGLGPVFGFSTTVFVTQKIAVIGMVNRRGFSGESNGKSIAGSTIAIGTQIGLFF